MRTVLVSKFEPDEMEGGRIKVVPFQFSKIGSFSDAVKFVKILIFARKVETVFISNPQFLEMLFCFLVRLIYAKKIRIVFFDLILRRPASFSDRVLRLVKRMFLSAVDVFLCIHKDVSGYSEVFGVRQARCKYVPFKANNFNVVDKYESVDGGYALSLGASHRDYALLVEAVRGLDVNLKIILPGSSVDVHNAKIQGVELPSNVERITSFVDSAQWNTYLAQSRFVVVPILPGTIQPAGISMYLEAMALGKSVIVTAGSSTEGLLDSSLAVMVPPGDVAAMRQAISQLWHGSEFRKELSENGMRYARSLGGHARLRKDLSHFLAHGSFGE